MLASLNLGLLSSMSLDFSGHVTIKALLKNALDSDLETLADLSFE